MPVIVPPLAVCSWSLQPADPAQLADRLDAVGLPRVQLALNPLIHRPAVWARAGDVLAQRGIAIVSGMFGTIGEDYSTLDAIRRTGGLVPDEHWDANRRLAADAASAAADLGLTLVTSHAGFLPRADDLAAFDKLQARVAEVASIFHQRGIALLLETGQETASTLLAFLQSLHARGATNVGVNFDPANMLLYNQGDPIAALAALLPHVRQVHLKDARRTATPGTWGRETPVGEGEVDWRAFVNTLRAGGFTGPWVIEREGGPQRIDDVRQAARLIADLLTGATPPSART